MSSLDKPALPPARATVAGALTADASFPSADRAAADGTSADRAANEPRRHRPEVLPEPGVHLLSYLEVPFVHKRIIAGCIVGSLLAGWLALLVWPRKYESEARLLIRVGRESVSLDPTATTSQTLMLQKTQEEEVNSTLEVLSSRRVAERVVDELGEDAVLAGALPSAEETASATGWKQTVKQHIKNYLIRPLDVILVHTGIRDVISNRELAVMQLQKSVNIYAPKKSTVVTVRAESKTPAMARAIVQSLTNNFLDQHLDISRTEGSQEFFYRQSQTSLERLDELIDRKNAYLQEHKIVSIDANRGMLTQQLAAIDHDLILARGELEQALAEVEDLKEKAAIAPEEIVAAKDAQSDMTWSGMRQRVYELELLEMSLAAMSTAEHPRLAQVREQLQGARDVLARLQSERVNQSTTPNPAKRRMEEDLQRQQTKTAGLRSLIAEKLQQRGSVEREVRALLDHERTMTRMDRDIALLETSLRLLRDKQEEARVIDELKSQRISNISVFQPATFVERAVSPQKKVLAAAFVLLGLVGGLGLAYLREWNSETLRTADHVESKLGLPVLADIPRFRRRGSLAPWERLAKNSILRATCRSVLSEMLLSRRLPAPCDTRGRSIGILAVADGCGASTFAAALAITASEDGGLRTTLIDADLRNRSVSGTFGLNGAPGFLELLSGEANSEECVHRMEERPLELISSSARSAGSGWAADPRAARGVLAEIQQDCDLVILDLPPASRPDQAMSMAPHLDQVLIVVESERTDVTHVHRLVQRLTASDTEILGIVLNKTRSYMPRLMRRLMG
ncbi:MAG: GumC family protein [Pirellulaceae bacterium]